MLGVAQGERRRLEVSDVWLASILGRCRVGPVGSWLGRRLHDRSMLDADGWYIRYRILRYTNLMTKRLVDIDGALLDEATRILGASTMKEAVNRSLEEVVLAARRRRHADRLSELRDLDLADPEVMAGAWR